MPLLHQETARTGGPPEHRRSFEQLLSGFDGGGNLPESAATPVNRRRNETARTGGPPEHRRSIADFFSGFDGGGTIPESAATPVNHRGNNANANASYWEPGSPEAAHTPRALVPAVCFPSRHPRAFTSYSETARPGSGWSDDNSNQGQAQGQGITDLVASLKALAMPAPHSRVETAIQFRLRYDSNNKEVEPPWSPEPNGPTNALMRRASFCGGGMVPGEAVTWRGVLPPRGSGAAGYSNKVFVGGLPWDMTDTSITNTLRNFQPLRVEWPGQDATPPVAPRGFVYVTFDSERRVRALLATCRKDGTDYYYRVSTKKMRFKEAQVIPWAVTDTDWVAGVSVRLEPSRTVFVGALHGTLTAPALAHIMNDLFPGVVYAGLDTDKHKYPIGSGRVTFNNVHSYVRAISAGYVEIVTDKFTKKVQVDPYLEDSMCSVCNLHQGPYFCREPKCFKYFCRVCWARQHAREAHKPLTRQAKVKPDPHAGGGGGGGGGDLANNFAHSEGASPSRTSPSGASGSPQRDAAEDG